MQVSNAQDNITHAIIGGNETMDFGISNSAEFFQILSSSLYTNQILAVVREVLCNAWDAHIEAGKQDVPIFVSMANNEFTVRDYGTGIHKDDIQEIYGIYGQSTKRQKGNVTGGFGLGCKAPFAYRDHFEVTSWNQGEQTIYAMCRSSGETNGKPGITPIVSMPTEESGLQVKVSVKETDRNAFITYIKQVVLNGEINVLFEQEPYSVDEPVILETVPYSKATDGFTIVKATGTSTATGSHINIRYGNVIYPVNDNNAYYHEFSTISTTLKKATSYSCSSLSLVLQAEPDSICVAPSREALSMQAKTINTVKLLLQNFISKTSSKAFNDRFAFIGKKLAEESFQKGEHTVASLFSSGIYCGLTSKLPIQTVDNFIESILINNKCVCDLRLIHKYALQCVDPKQKGTLQSYLKAIENQVSPSKWYFREVVVKTQIAIAKIAPTVTTDMLYYRKEGRWNNVEKDFQELSFYSMEVEDLIKKTVVLTCAPSTVKSRLEDWPDKLHKRIILIQPISRTDPNLDKLRNALSQRTDLDFIDLTIKHSWEIKDQITSPAKPKVKGVVSAYKLAYDYKPKQGKDHLNAEKDFITEPIFVIYMGRGDDYLVSPFSRYMEKELFKRFGKQGGICTTDTSLRSYLSKGAVTFTEYIVQKIYDHLIKNNRVKRYNSITVSAKKAENDLANAILVSDDLSKYFGIYTALTDDDRFFYKLYLELLFSSLKHEKLSKITSFFTTYHEHAFFSMLRRVTKEDILMKHLNTYSFSKLLNSHVSSEQDDKQKAISILKLKLKD